MSCFPAGSLIWPFIGAPYAFARAVARQVCYLTGISFLRYGMPRHQQAASALGAVQKRHERPSKSARAWQFTHIAFTSDLVHECGHQHVAEHVLPFLAVVTKPVI